MRTVPLGELVTIKGGGTPSRDQEAYWNGGVPWASVKDFKNTEICQTVESITALGLANSASNLIPAGAILVPTRMAVGKAAINTIDLAINQDLKALFPSKSADTRYLLRVLLASANSLERLSTGATVKGITLEILKELPVPLPPLPEQRRIAAILDQADALRAKRREALAKLDEMAQAIFVEMFVVNPDRADWPTAPLGDLCNLVRGSSPRPQGDPRFFGGPVPRLMIADITRDGMVVEPKIDSLTVEGATKSRQMSAGSVVMAVSGAVGLPAILAKDACIHDGFVGFRSLDKRVQPIVLYYWLKFERVRNSAKGTGAIWVNLTTDQVKEFSVPLAPANLQRNFIASLMQIQAMERKTSESSLKLDFLFSSLQHRAFSGEL